MTVRLAGDVIYLEGRCLAEDADTLLVYLQECPKGHVDMARVERLHLAVFQILLAAKPEVRAAPPRDGFVARHLIDLLL
ncbi:hypothetical protein ACNFJ7_02715 [Sphingomonas sp. HT-1]|uniref:hypothetical protein n=1 Tax=unclassified Sphingomonas TaxID=196159 RepID=UPI0002E26196|nr:MULTISPECIES: hypothetical protein [unclassified Sphingomonas]